MCAHACASARGLGGQIRGSNAESELLVGIKHYSGKSKVR